MEGYKYIFIPMICLIICQIIKFTMESYKYRSLEWNRLINGAGGMPSAHASFSFALTATLGQDLGISSPIFAISLIFSMIVCYDAMGVRFESGKQAEVINDLAEIVEKEKRHRITFEHLKEQLGHKPMEVIMGILLGTIISILFNLYIF